MNRIALLFAFIAVVFLATVESKAQCASGNCSRANASLDSSLPAPIPVPVPAPAPAAASSAAASSFGYAPAPASGALVVGGYTAPAPSVAYYTAPAPQVAYSVVPVAYAPAAVSTATSAASTATAPALIGASVLPGGGQSACSSGGCGRGGFLKGIRARRGGSFSKSVSISRS